MNRGIKPGRAGLVLVGALLLQGCVTHIYAPTKPNEAPKKKFSTFNKVVMRQVAIAPEFAKARSNQRAANKINEVMFKGMSELFPNIELSKDNAQVTGADTLVIEPLVEQVKFINIGARIMVGMMAGSSAVLMKVTYRDAGSGEVIAEAKFYERAGGGSYGADDNMMLVEVAQDACRYTSRHR